MSFQDTGAAGVEPLDPSDFLAREMRGASVRAVQALDANPDDAARALNLSAATGIPSPVIDGDLDHYDNQHRARLTTELLNNNPALQAYVNSHPLAAKISNDDYGQLDAVSEAVQKHGQKGFIENTTEVLHDVLKTLKEGPTEYKGIEDTAKAYLIKNGMDPAQAEVQAASIGRRAYEGEALTNILFALPTVIGSPLIGAYRTYVSQPIESHTGFPAAATETLTIAGLAALGLRTMHKAEPWIREGKSPPVGVDEAFDKAKVEEAKLGVDKLNEALKASVASTTRERNPELFASFVREVTDGEIGITADAIRELYGDKPPAPDDGLLGWVPGLQEKMAAASATGGDVWVPIADWLAHVEPEVAKQLEDHIRARPEGMTKEEAKEHVTPEEPERIVGSGIKIGDQLVTAPTHGEALEAIAKNLGISTTEVIEKHIGSEDLGGFVTSKGRYVSREEALDIAKNAEQFHFDEKMSKAGYDPTALVSEDLNSSARRSIRQSAGLQGIQERKLTLERFKTEGNKDIISEGETSHGFALTDQQGQELGELYITEEKGGKRLYVDDIRTNTPYEQAANSLGPRAMREILVQIKEQFPNAETLDGFRASGARQIADPKGLGGSVSIDLTKIKPRAKPPTEPEPSLLQQVKEAIVGKSPEQVAAEAKALDERAAFEKASAIGMTVDQYKRYQTLIERRMAEDAEAASVRAVADQRKRQTAEWKANRAELRPQVAESIRAQADHELDGLLREGKVRFASDSLTDAQRAGLPKEYLAKDGIAPDDLAGMFGDTTGGQLVDRVVALNEARRASGMKPAEFERRVIEAETDRQMEAKYGELDRNILEEAKDQVLSEVQEELLHEETLARANEAGLEFSINKDEYKAALRGFFDRQPLRDISTDRSLAEAGRAGRAAEMALLKGDYAEAFRQKQRQYNAFVMGNFAKQLEKAQGQFDRLAKRFSAREVASVEQEYTNWIHDILGRTGNTVKRSIQDLQESLARGEQKTLAEFVEYKVIHDLREVPIADFIADPAFRKPLDSLTPPEFEALHDAVKTLAKNGRDELKATKAGEEADLNVVKQEMISQLQEFAQKNYDAKGGRWLTPYIPPDPAKKIRSFGMAHLQIETIFNRLDRGNPWGVFTQYVMRDLVNAANRESALEREWAAKYRELKDKEFDHRAKVDNPLFMDPYSVSRGEPVPIPMTRENVRAIIMNVGNKSNFDKLARGYLNKLDPEMAAGDNAVAMFKGQIMDWLARVSTKEDWDWAQQYGDLFAEFKAKHVDPMYRRVSGIEPQSVPIEPLQTPHGEYKGWYYPVMYHPLWEGVSRKLMGGEALEGHNYVRATTPQGYVEKRTGYAGPMDLSLDRGVSRLRQMIHDVAFRESVINASKIFYDKDVRAAIAQHYGKEARDMLVPYLKDVANAASLKNELSVLDNSIGETVRQNLIAVLVGMNPGTVAKHGLTALYQSMNEVGPKEFLNAVLSMGTKGDFTAESNWQMARTKSEEIQRRVRNYQEVLRGGSENLFKDVTWRDMMQHLGSYPVAMSDLLSAVPTWLAQYKKTLLETGQEGDAIFMADRAVRRAHGSTAITNRPEIMRRGNLWFASLYGFFNHIMNRQYEITWKAHDALTESKGERLVKGPDGTYELAKTPSGMRTIGTLSAATIAYIIYPALVEELVTPLPHDKKEGWGKWAAKGLFKDLSSSWVYARDIAQAVVTGRDPSAGLVSTGYKMITDVARDMNKDRPFAKQNLGRTVQHGISLFGTVSGLANQQMGRDARFMYNYLTGQEKPKGFADWYRGLRYGTIKPLTR